MKPETYGDTYSKVRIEGGPHGIGTKVFVDDVEQRGVSSLEFEADARYANRLTVHQFVSVAATIECIVDHDYHASVHLTLPDGEVVLLDGRGSTPQEAIVNAVKGDL
jgi:fructose-1,6-bisphosphatase/sedoheptulose 1,7-bisphosphatase-like protein